MTDDVLHRLARANPVSASSPPEHATPAAVARRDAIAASPPPRLRMRPHRAVLVAVAAWAALIAGLALLVPRGHEPVSPAQALLQKAASTAGMTGPPRQIPAGTWWYRHAITISGPQIRCGIPVEIEADAELWLAPDSTLHQRVSKRALPYRPADAPHLVGHCFGSDDRGLSNTTYGPAISDGTLGALVAMVREDGIEVHAAEIAALPSDPDQLEQVFRRWNPSSSQPSGMASLLSLPELPGDVAAGIYQLVARSPGLDVRPGAHDWLGRPATAIDLGVGRFGSGWWLFFDPESGQLLGAEERTIGPYRVGAGGRTVPAGSVLQATTVISRAA